MIGNSQMRYDVFIIAFYEDDERQCVCDSIALAYNTIQYNIILLESCHDAACTQR